MTRDDEAEGRETPLGRRLAARIARHGPLTLAEYMAAVLTDPEHGYYMGGDPFGAAGDFVTAPEVSQMFGELLGLWCLETWRAMGAPAPLRLVELGPGRGSLMADALRAARLDPAFAPALRLHLVEVSPALRDLQAARLAPLIEPAAVTWHDHLGEVPEGPLLLLANEFFDALPLRQFERAPAGWCERLVVASPDGSGLDFALSRPSPLFAPLLPAALRDAPPSAVAEVSPPGLALAAEIGRRVAAHGGAALIVDYGGIAPSGKPTLQALRRHRPAAVLEAPGAADLTAHVDFAALAEAAAGAGAGVHGPLPQGDFLLRLGIAERAARLAAGAGNRQAGEVRAALHRLTDPAEMGRLFKALAIAHPGLPAPAGFG